MHNFALAPGWRSAWISLLAYTELSSDKEPLRRKGKRRHSRSPAMLAGKQRSPSSHDGPQYSPLAFQKDHIERVVGILAEKQLRQNTFSILASFLD